MRIQSFKSIFYHAKTCLHEEHQECSQQNPDCAQTLFKLINIYTLYTGYNGAV